MVTTSERASRSKLEAMLQNLYTKTTQVILQARVPITSSKENKWFCLNTPHLSKVQSELRRLHCAIPQALDGATLPPLVILITLPLQLLSLDERRHLLGNTTPPRGKTTLVIEAWTVTLKSAPFAKMDLPRFYKHAIAFFRSLYSLVRLLPAYHWLTTTTRPLAYRMGLADLYHEHEIPMASPTPPHATRPSYQSHALTMTTPIGQLNLSVRYRDMDFCVPSSSSPMPSQCDACPFPLKHQNPSPHEQHGLFRSQSSPLLNRDDLENVRSSTAAGLRTGPLQQRQRPQLLHRPSISPFKSPSLSDSNCFRAKPARPSSSGAASTSSSTKTTESTPTTPRHHHQAPPAPLSPMTSTPEFFSSFERRRSRAPTPTRKQTMMTTEQLGTMDSDMEDFMHLIQNKPTLKLFQSRSSTCLHDSHIWSPPATEEANQSSYFAGATSSSIQKSKRSLSYYRSLRHDHSDFSESMASTLSTSSRASLSSSIYASTSSSRHRLSQDASTSHD